MNGDRVSVSEPASDTGYLAPAQVQTPGLCPRCGDPWVAHGGIEEPICHDERAAYGPPFCSVQGCRGRWQPDMPHNHEVSEPYLGGFSRSQIEAMTKEPESARPHRHLIVRHVHPEWHGHCGDPLKRGWKPCGRPHWHFWWKHSHPDNNGGRRG